MITWKEFVQTKDDVDFKEIQSIYNKSHIAIDLVREYNPKLLDNISTIANLSSGAYGVYMSGENKKQLPPEIQQGLIYYGKIHPNGIGNLPTKTIKQYYPNLRDEDIKRSDTIHINVARILKEKGQGIEALLEIAATIVHEATHEIEREATGQTSEVGPERAERDFLNWATSRMQQLIRKYPELNQVSPQGQLGQITPQI